MPITRRSLALLEAVDTVDSDLPRLSEFVVEFDTDWEVAL